MSTKSSGAFYLEVGLRSLQGGGERLYYKRDKRAWGSKAKAFCEQEADDDAVIKLNVLQMYGLTVTVRPGKPVKYMWVDGEKLDLKYEKHIHSDSDLTKYTAQWTTTGYDITKPGQRKKIPIEVEFTSGEFLKSDLQAKFYGAADTAHSRVGRMFTLISLLCQAPEHTFVNVLKKQLL